MTSSTHPSTVPMSMDGTRFIQPCSSFHSTFRFRSFIATSTSLCSSSTLSAVPLSERHSLPTTRSSCHRFFTAIPTVRGSVPPCTDFSCPQASRTATNISTPISKEKRVKRRRMTNLCSTSTPISVPTYRLESRSSKA